MWIMFRNRPACDPEYAPPKMSIFWSTPWPIAQADKSPIRVRVSFSKVNRAVVDAAWDEWIKTSEGGAFERSYGKPKFAKLKSVLPYSLLEKYLREIVYTKTPEWLNRPPYGREYDWDHARAIKFKGETIRVFPEEFTQVSDDEMHRWVAGGSHELVASDVSEAEQRILGELTTGLQHVVYEEALVAGCDHTQATVTALGGDPTEGMSFPPIGWYKCALDFKWTFCRWEEMEPDEQEALEAKWALEEGVTVDG